MGSKRTLFDALQGKFEEEEYLAKKTVYVDGLKIKVISQKNKNKRPNTPLKAGNSNAYVIYEDDEPKQITMYTLNIAGENVKSRDIDLEEHTHKTGYSGNPHVHDYSNTSRGNGREPTKEEIALMAKILRRLKE